MLNRFKQEVADFKNTDWYIEELSGCLHVFYTPLYSNMVTLSEEFPHYHKITIGIFRGDVGNFIWKMSDCLRIGQDIFQSLCQDEQFLDHYYRKWEKYYRELQSVFVEIDTLNLEKLSKTEFIGVFNKFNLAYMKEYSIPLVTNAFSFYAEKHLRELLADNFTKYFSDLSAPTRRSFMTNSELSLLEIASLANNKGIDDKSVKSVINEHVKKFHWLENNYIKVKYLDKSFVVDEVKKRLKNPEQKIEEIKQGYQTAKQRKEDIFKEITASQELKLLVESLDFFVHWQDQRKKASLEALHCQYKLLDEIVRRTYYSLEEIQYTMYSEIEDVLTEKLDKLVLQDRRQKCVVYLRDDHQLHFHTGQEAQYIIDSIFPNTDGIKELQGTVTSADVNNKIVQGEVSVVSTMNEAKSFKPGNILVTSMTRPDMISIMKQAKAVITNEGGVTCHAAVVSRELGIPCIIGTKVATKVLKNGYTVEMDLDKGTVKIIG